MKALTWSLVLLGIVILAVAALLALGSGNWLLAAAFGIPALALFVGGQYVAPKS